VADDYDLMRLGLRRFLEVTFKGALIEEAADGKQTLDFVRQKPWDLLLLDLSLPDKHGLDILQDIKQARPELPVLVFSGMGEDEFAVAAVNAGASGFVSKGSSIQELTLAVQKVLAGGKYVSPALANKMALGFLSKSPGPLHQSLSEREFQVLRLTASRPRGRRHRRHSVPQRQDGQHLSRSAAGKDADALERRIDALRLQAPPRQLAAR